MQDNRLQQGPHQALPTQASAGANPLPPHGSQQGTPIMGLEMGSLPATPIPQGFGQPGNPASPNFGQPASPQGNMEAMFAQMSNAMNAMATMAAIQQQGFQQVQEQMKLQQAQINHQLAIQAQQVRDARVL
eukprot:7415766-Heterocapsa_arctica.AAC.1